MLDNYGHFVKASRGSSAKRSAGSNQNSRLDNKSKSMPRSDDASEQHILVETIEWRSDQPGYPNKGFA